MTKYTLIERPGYFGRRRDQRIAALNDAHGKGNWTLVWQGDMGLLEFEDACKKYYEASYLRYFLQNIEQMDFVCEFDEVMDNAETNIFSGCDYTKQEAFSTHIQDIAIRNVMKVLGYEFPLAPMNANDINWLVVRGPESNGFRFNPGQIDFYEPKLIIEPSLAPQWAQPGSVEDFWQSNKWVALKEE